MCMEQLKGYREEETRMKVEHARAMLALENKVCEHLHQVE